MRANSIVLTGLLMMLSSHAAAARARYPHPTVARTARAAADSCRADSNARRFDFWLGAWSVTPAHANTVVGHSLIQRVSGGCALLENWTSSGGIEGKSLNAYNPALGQWQQFWVGQNGGTTEYRESRWDGATLILLAHSQSSRGAYLQRLSFTPIDSNTVRQFGEMSTDSGKTWMSSYDFCYHRMTSPSTATGPSSR